MDERKFQVRKDTTVTRESIDPQKSLEWVSEQNKHLIGYVTMVNRDSMEEGTIDDINGGFKSESEEEHSKTKPVTT